VKKLRISSFVMSVFFLLFSSNSYALTYQVDFTVSDFLNVSSISPSTPAPYIPISGSMLFNAASINSPIDSLLSVNLAIGSHTYVLSELGFENSSTLAVIGRTIFSVIGIGENYDDFWLSWNLSTLQPYSFGYTTSDVGGAWVLYEGVAGYEGLSFDSFSIYPPIPEPATFILLGSGLAGLFWYGRKRKNA